ncbi:nucleolar-like protein [Wolffia australiana]
MVKGRANSRGSKSSIPTAGKMLKKKKKNAKRLLTAPDAAAQKSAKPILENPFENIYSRRKLEIIGKKRKSEDRRISLARSRAVEKRKQTLLKDYEQSRKSSKFIDKRIGEADDALGEFEKGILRLQRERQQKLKKSNRHDPFDAIEDVSQPQEEGRFLGADDFQDEVPLDDEDDNQTLRDPATLRHLPLQGMHEFSESGSLQGENRRKTKKEVMEEIIAKSKYFKAQKASEKEVDEHLTEQLDKNFESLLKSKSFLSLNQSSVGSSKQMPIKGLTDVNSGSNQKVLTKDQQDAYDKLVKELPMDKRARPSDRKKSAEEIAQEERERLESLEEERQRRMNGQDDSDDEESGEDDDTPKTTKRKFEHMSGDDLGDSLISGHEHAEKTCHVDDIVRCIAEKSMNDEVNDDESGKNETEEEEQEEEEDDDDGDEDDSDDDERDEDSEDEHCVKDWEQSDDNKLSSDDEGEAENPASEKIESNPSLISDSARKPSLIKEYSLPFVIEAPKDIVELSSLIDHRLESEIVEAINRIRICNAIKLSAENRRKMQVFYGVLLQYFAVQTTKSPLNVKLLNLLVKPLVEMGAETPYFAAICARERLLRLRNQLCETLQTEEGSAWPSLKTLLLFRLWSLTFPCSDFRHVVMTPASLLMCEYLMRCPITTERDIAIGSFLCSMLLSVAKQSNKLYPEVLTFLRLLLTSATKTLSGVFFADFKSLKPWLFLGQRDSSVALIDFFMIINLPADSPYFSSDNFRASILLSTVETLRGFVKIYENLTSFPEIFIPIRSLLDEIVQQPNIPESLRENMEGVSNLIEEKAGKHETLRLPLQMRKQKPAPIKLLNPKFEEDFAKGRDYDPDRERVERKKLKKLLKKEAKGAVRELRKDNYFLHEVKKKERVLEEEEKAEMYGKARAFLQEQEHAYKSGQLGKGKKGRR